MMNKKVALIVSHPIQHFCPQYASWAKSDLIELKVFFGSNLGAVKYLDHQFKEEISWTNLYLDEFNHEFLNGEKTLQPTPDLDAENLDIKLNEFEPHLVIYYGYYQNLAKRARNWALKNKVKTAYISDAENKQKRPLWKLILKFPFLYFFYKKIDYFFTVGDANEAYYKFYGVPEIKMHRMMFSIDKRNYDAAFEKKELLRASFREANLIPKNEIVFSVVGKLVSWKSQDDLIKLLISLEDILPNNRFHLLIAGSGPMEMEWKRLSMQLTSNKVHFLGFINPTELPQIYATTDIYIHPAKIEPHSLSISEAIYMGCPVVVANTTGSWGENDDVQTNKNGFVYQHGDIKELERRISQILQLKRIGEFRDYSVKISRNFQNKSHFGIIKNIYEDIFT